jgi:hypothetical protein
VAAPHGHLRRRELLGSCRADCSRSAFGQCASLLESLLRAVSLGSWLIVSFLGRGGLCCF